MILYSSQLIPGMITRHDTFLHIFVYPCSTSSEWSTDCCKMCEEKWWQTDASKHTLITVVTFLFLCWQILGEPTSSQKHSEPLLSALCKWKYKSEIPNHFCYVATYQFCVIIPDLQIWESSSLDYQPTRVENLSMSCHHNSTRSQALNTECLPSTDINHHFS